MARTFTKQQIAEALRVPLQLLPPESSLTYLHCLAEARQHHAQSKTYSGKFLRPHAPLIKQLIDELGGATSILDYGCGKGAQYEWVSHGGDASIPQGMTIEQYWGVPVTKFDPAYPPFEVEPLDQQFDIVICTHSLGSIPVGDLPWVLMKLFHYARKAVYIAEKIGPVRKQVFSRPEEMPRWNADQWARCISAARKEYLLVRGESPALNRPYCKFVTREKTETGVVMQARWL